MKLPGSNANRREQAQQKIRDKIKVLEEYLLNGVPSGCFVPKSLNEFREWEDEAVKLPGKDVPLKLEKIGSPNTLNRRSSPENTELIEKINVLIGELSRTAKKPKRPRTPLKVELENAKAVSKEKDGIISGLASSLHQARHEIKELKDQLTAQANNRSRRVRNTPAKHTEVQSNGARPKLNLVT